VQDLLSSWAESAWTSLGLFWMAFWAFGLGYLVSSGIQVFVTERRMRRAMGQAGPKSVAMATFFGFVSSSCSFAALSTSRTLLAKGAGLVPSLAFLLASTNLVVELGIVIATFLAWPFVVGEYVGGLLLIGATWAIVRLTSGDRLEEEARTNARASADLSEDDEDPPPIGSRLTDLESWRDVADRYRMEWGMVWKDVTIGFTVAGIIATFVPHRFFEVLFVGSSSDSASFPEVLAQTLVGPLAAFFTFIGSMGNIPLAAVLFSNGVSFAGVLAFIFSDLVVFPVLRIQASYYGWKVALYILAVFLTALVGTSLVVHYGFDLVGALPDASSARSVTDRTFFSVDYTLFLNVIFGIVTVGAFAWSIATREATSSAASSGERVLQGFTALAIVWLVGGVTVSAAGLAG